MFHSAAGGCPPTSSSDKSYAIPIHRCTLVHTMQAMCTQFSSSHTLTVSDDSFSSRLDMPSGHRRLSPTLKLMIDAPLSNP